jgi:Cu+-exporting ATPase
VLREGGEVRVPVDQLAVGEHFVVRPGEKITTDGVVVSGSSAWTPRCSTRVGADTQLAQMARLVKEAQAGKAPAQRLADRISAVFVPVVTGVAVVTLAGWLPAGEEASEHPIAAAIAVGARDRLGGALPAVTEFASHQGLGVTGMVDRHAVAVGRALWLDSEWAMTVPAGLAARAAAAEAAGQTAVFAGWDGAVRGALVVSDTIKPTSAEAVRRLRGLGLSPVLLTGDNERAARSVAETVGIGEVIAGVLPAGKVAAIRRLQQAGRVVAMAGDGVNDAAALAQADLGLAMGTGTDAAIEASDLTLVRGDLLAVPDAIGLSRRTLATIKGNLFWAFGYNAAAIPLAALGLLNPLIAAAAMAFSSVFVVTNSLRPRSFRPFEPAAGQAGS